MGASIAEGGLDDDEDYAEAHEITTAKFLDSAREIYSRAMLLLRRIAAAEHVTGLSDGDTGFRYKALIQIKYLQLAGCSFRS